jgi:hypothetical protein
MTLTQSKRVLEGHVQLQRISNRVRGLSEETLSMPDAEYLCSFILTTKSILISKTRNRSKKMLYFVCKFGTKK